MVFYPLTFQSHGCQWLSVVMDNDYTRRHWSLQHRGDVLLQIHTPKVRVLGTDAKDALASKLQYAPSGKMAKCRMNEVV